MRFTPIHNIVICTCRIIDQLLTCKLEPEHHAVRILKQSRSQEASFSCGCHLSLSHDDVDVVENSREVKKFLVSPIHALLDSDYI